MNLGAHGWLDSRNSQHTPRIAATSRQSRRFESSRHLRTGRLDLSQEPTYAAAVQLDARTELVIAVDIAKRLGLTKQRIGQLAQLPTFPAPVGVLGRSTVWRWSSVEAWARETGRLPAAD